MNNVLNIPKYILWALLAVTIVFSLIFFFGSTEKVTCNGIPLDAPTFTSAYLVLAVVFVAIATLVTLAFAIKSFASKVSYDSKSVMIPLIAFAALALLLIITYFGADTQKINIVGYEGAQDPWVYQITNMCIVSSFVLAGIAFIAAICSPLLKNLKK